MQLLPLPGTTPEMWDNIGMKLYACVNVYLSRYLIYENVYVHLCMCMHMYICRSVYMYNYALSKSVQGKEKKYHAIGSKHEMESAVGGTL